MLPIFLALLVTGFLLGCPPVAEAQTWNGSVSDLWGTAANWTPNTVPNSNTTSATVTSATNNPVLIDINPTIANLTVGATNSVTLDNGNSLTHHWRRHHQQRHVPARTRPASTLTWSSTPPWSTTPAAAPSP